MSRRPGAARPAFPPTGPPPIKFDDDAQGRASPARRGPAKTPPPPRTSNPMMPFAGMEMPKQRRGYSAVSPSQKPRSAFARFQRWLLRNAIFFGSIYTLLGAVFLCSSSPLAFDYNARDDRAVCRSLAAGKKHLVPILTPYVQAAHAKIDPYTGPYIKAASPYAQKAWKTTRPYYRAAQKQSAYVYKKHVDPVRKKALKRTRTYLDPHVKTARGHYNKKVQPHVDTVQDALKPYQKMYMRDVAPYLSQAYAYSLSAGATSYSVYVQQVHPQVVKGVQQTHAFYINNADPAMRRAYSLYIRPQVDKLMAKLFQRKAHAVEEEILQETKQHVREAEEEAKSRASSASAATRSSTEAPDATGTGIAATVQQAASSVVQQVKPKVSHHVPDTLMGSDPDEMSPEKEAEIEKLQQEELDKVKKQLEAWETGMTNLFNEEYKLFTQRIGELRDTRMADLPDHFDGLMSTAENEVSSIIEKLAQKYEGLSSQSDAEDRASQLKQLIETPMKRLRQSRSVADEAIRDYAVALAKDEAKARDASVAELRSFVKEAITSYNGLMDETEFERVLQDFEGWDKGMAARVRLFATELDDLRRGNGTLRSGLGALDLRTGTSNVAPYLQDLRQQVEKLYNGAADSIESYGRSSPLEGVGAAAEAVRKQARDLLQGADTSMSSAVRAARARLGLAADTVRKSARDTQEKVAETAEQANEVVADAADAAAEAATGQTNREPRTPAEPAQPKPVPGADSVIAGDEPVIRIQPVDMPGDGVDAEGNVVGGADIVDEGQQASEQFGAKGSGEGRATVLEAAEQGEAEDELHTPIDEESAEQAAAQADTAEYTPDRVVEASDPEPAPAFSIQPVDMPGDGVDAEGQPVDTQIPAEAVPASTPSQTVHEEL